MSHVTQILSQIESSDPNADYTARRNVMIVKVGFRCDIRVLQRIRFELGKSKKRFESLIFSVPKYAACAVNLLWEVL